jgi:hypothetical protein
LSARIMMVECSPVTSLCVCRRSRADTRPLFSSTLALFSGMYVCFDWFSDESSSG